MEMREYIISFFQRRFNPTATEYQIAAIETFLDDMGEDEEHKLCEMFKIVDAEEIDS